MPFVEIHAGDVVTVSPDQREGQFRSGSDTRGHDPNH